MGPCAWCCHTWEETCGAGREVGGCLPGDLLGCPGSWSALCCTLAELLPCLCLSVPPSLHTYLSNLNQCKYNLKKLSHGGGAKGLDTGNVLFH